MTAAIDFTKNAKLMKAAPGMYRHDGDRFPGLYLNVGKRRSMDLSRFSAAPVTHLCGLLFESQGTFPTER